MMPVGKDIRVIVKAVMPGLDPGIHLHDASTKKMDGRVKPGHDVLFYSR
jgi:hypothetical protein